MQHKILNHELLSEKIKFLTDTYQAKYQTMCDKEEWEMGIDEAGRGPVLGPMVYASCCWPISLKEELASIGFFDSKQVNEENREYFFEILQSLNGKCLYFEHNILTPELISNKMLQKEKENLNEMSYQAAFQLIQSTINKLNVSHVYLDTVGKPEYYQSRLDSRFNEYSKLNFTVSEKADAKFPVVSAASIVAKVTRDHCVKKWVFNEDVEGRVSKKFGSGYPGDPNTVEWLDNNRNEVFGFVDFVRFSWKTIDTILEKKGVEVDYSGNAGKNPFGIGGKSWMHNVGLKEEFQI